MNKPKISIVIPTLNRKKELINCLNSIKQQSYPNYSIIVVDNCSSDETSKLIKKEFPKVNLIKNRKNLGFAKALNQGLRLSIKLGQPDFYFVLNDDAILDKNCLSELIKLIKSDEKIGAVGPIIFSMNKTNRIQSFGESFYPFLFITLHNDRNKLFTEKYGQIKEPDFISGCAMLLRDEVIKKVGLFDENYFAYYEDLDLSFRIRKAGYKLLATPDARIWHCNHSDKKYKTLKLYLKTKNSLFFIKKNYKGFSKLLNLIGFVVFFIPMNLIINIEHPLASIKAILKAIFQYKHAFC